MTAARACRRWAAAGDGVRWDAGQRGPGRTAARHRRAPDRLRSPRRRFEASGPPADKGIRRGQGVTDAARTLPGRPRAASVDCARRLAPSGPCRGFLARPRRLHPGDAPDDPGPRFGRGGLGITSLQHGPAAPRSARCAARQRRQVRGRAPRRSVVPVRGAAVRTAVAPAVRAVRGGIGSVESLSPATRGAGDSVPSLRPCKPE